jgi:hypothetical protein
MDGTLEERLAAVERALTDGEHDCEALAEGAATADRVSDLETDFEELTDRVAELEAATQALRGYVGNVRSVNEEVEQRADRALEAATEARRAAESVDRTDGRPADPDPVAGHPERGSEGTRSEHGSRESYCEHCDRPFGDRPDRPESSGSRTDEPGLEGVRNRSSGPEIGSGPQDGVATTETDGGVDRFPETDDRPGLVARIRDLL